MPRLQVFVDFLPFESFSVRREFFFFLDPFSFVLPNHFYDFQQSFVAVLDDYFGFLMTSSDFRLIEFVDFVKSLDFENFETGHRSDKPLSRHWMTDLTRPGSYLTPFDLHLTQNAPNEPIVALLVATLIFVGAFELGFGVGNDADGEKSDFVVVAFGSVT